MDKPISPGLDPVHDYLHYEGQPLDAIFAPKSVAVVGATVGTRVACAPAAAVLVGACAAHADSRLPSAALIPTPHTSRYQLRIKAPFARRL